MFEEKLDYSQPQCEVRVVRFSERIMSASFQDNTIKDATVDEWEDEL